MFSGHDARCDDSVRNTTLKTELQDMDFPTDTVNRWIQENRTSARELSSGFTLYVIAWLLVCAAAVCAVLVARSPAKPSSVGVSDLQTDSKEMQPIPDPAAPAPTQRTIQISGMNLCVVFLMTIASFLLFTSFESPLWAKKVREKSKEMNWV